MSPRGMVGGHGQAAEGQDRSWAHQLAACASDNRHVGRVIWLKPFDSKAAFRAKQLGAVRHSLHSHRGEVQALSVPVCPSEVPEGTEGPHLALGRRFAYPRAASLGYHPNGGEAQAGWATKW